MNKEIAFLMLLQSVVSHVPSSVLQPVAPTIERKLCECCAGDHFLVGAEWTSEAKIAEKSLKLWDNERFAENMKSVADLSLFRKTLKDSEEHYWCIEVHPDFAHVLGICACFVCWKGGAIDLWEKCTRELGPPGSMRVVIQIHLVVVVVVVIEER